MTRLFWAAYFVPFCILLYQVSLHVMLCPPDPSRRDAIRKDWEKETTQHASLQRQWKRGIEKQTKIEQQWVHETEKHVHEVEETRRREREERERERREWQRETEEMRCREQAKREQERQRWQQEVVERDRREEEERLKRHMYWGNVKAHTCSTYATREYAAQLMNLPKSWERRVDACKTTLLEIHGISYLPETCEDKGPGVVIGRWEINRQEPDCRTFWDRYSDKGCTSPGSGKKCITHKLENLPKGSDWREFCATTPISFNNMQFRNAEGCYKTWWGVYGRWEVYDDNCFMNVFP